MPFLEIKPGRRTQTEGEWMTAEGAYQAILVEVTDKYKITPKAGFNAGVEVERIDWLFAIDSDDQYDGHLISYRTSTATGPRSGISALLTALFGGRTPPNGTNLEKEQLVGRSVILTLEYQGEYLNITNIGPVVQGRASSNGKAEEKPRHVATALDAGEVPVDGSIDDLPF